MKNSFVKIMTMAILTGLSGCSGDIVPAGWSSKETDKWFEKGEWLNGWTAKPDGSINRKAFAVSYFKHRERWDKAFAFMKENDLTKLELRRYDIDGDNAYALVSEYLTKNEEDARYEAHRNYIDVQYVVSGSEFIGITPIAMKKEILEAYDPAKDIEFLTVTQGVNFKAIPDRFFIFFAEDIHRPGQKEAENLPVRKVVLKIKIN